MPHALIIEDTYLIAMSVQEELRELGYSSFSAAISVSGALDAACDRSPDLIVSNHLILGGTGTDAVLEICSGADIPVVFVTGSRDEVRQRLPSAIIVDKPYTIVQLREAVEEAVRQPFIHPSPAGQTVPRLGE